jgi:hypothetical protein
VAPAQHRTVSRVDPITGERIAYRRLVRAAIVIPVCGEYRTVTAGQAPPVWTLREQRAPDVQQPGLFVTGEEARRNAIDRETGR